MKIPEIERVNLENIKLLFELKEVNHQQFIHDIIDSLCNKEPGLLKHSVFNSNDFEIVQDSIKAVKSFIIQTLNIENLDDFKAKFKNLSLDVEKAKIFYATIQSRREEIQNYYKKNTVELSSSYLFDFDWKLHVRF